MEVPSGTVISFPSMVSVTIFSEREAGVPLVPNPPLARALYKLELGREIPPDHYAAVAEIIAFVWRRRGGR